MPKYQHYFQEMVEYNSDLFNSFTDLSGNYASSPSEYQEALNDPGEKVLRIIRRYENMLCGKSENSGYGKYSTNLSEKFWGLVRDQFPHIDDVGKQ
jgi:hypothetical protein